MSKRLRKNIIIAVGIAIAIFLIYFLYRDYRPEINLLLHPNSHTKTDLMRLIRQHDIRDSLFLLGLIAVLNAIPGFSNSVFCVLAGMCYGPWLGFVINWFGNILGNCIVAGLIDKVDFSHKFKKNKILNFLMRQKHPGVAMTMGFMIPFIPSVLVNYTAVRLHVPKNRYLVMVVIGMFPTSFIYAFGGDAIFAGDTKKLITILILIVVLLLISVLLVKAAMKHHSAKNVD
ncbi:TVP38/TMEM64 family protein [uncultured Lactobacillus sp.]|uniref:TVP38/TMEM64 family protein n=1 Tax=uncultured Lactobacillus sp. TaxID=153152 RepID=UPI002617E3F9|nr:VTT domain-containing protein [uncultured Lactobacillus sp.]